MSAAVLGVAALTSAGDLPALLQAALANERHLTMAPPYASEGLSNPRCGLVAGLPRHRAAQALAEQVARAALADAGLGAFPEGAGLIVATSSGDIGGAWTAWHTAALAGGDAPEPPARDGPTEALRAALMITGPATTLSVACVSGTAALSVAEGWLADGVPAVLVVGVDALSRFVHAGFSGLGALSDALPRPFHEQRDGLVIGEGAAALLLGPSTALGVQLTATGHGSDATHITAPARDGRGAALALRAALERAGSEASEVDTVSVHGTGTAFNDGMEARALAAVFPPNSLAVSAIKGLIGHTMGAAGAIEAALCVHALRTRTALPSADPTCATEEDGASHLNRVLASNPTAPQHIASMSSAFGGVNTVALFRRSPGPALPAHPAEIAWSTTLDLPAGPWSTEERWPQAPERFRRLDRFTKAGWLGVQAAAAALNLPAETGLVLASRSNCTLSDRRFHKGLVERGPAGASRRAFIYTVPHAPLAEASIHLGLHGPLLAFVDDESRASSEAERLVRHGHCPVAVSVALEVSAPDSAVEVRIIAWHRVLR